MATKVKPSRINISGVPSVWQVPMYIDDETFQWWTAGSSWYGRFLSLWDCTTWQPVSFPEATPYAYTTWDYFMVSVVSTETPPVNYKPNGSSYTGAASSTTDSNEVLVWDVYVYDGSVWLLQSNNEKTVAFANIAWQPTDNTNLASALSWKLDTTALSDTAYWSSWDLDTTHTPTKNAVYDKIYSMDTTIWTKANDSDVVKLTWNQSIAWTKTFTTSPVVPSKTSDATNTWTAIATEAQVYKKQDTLTTQTAYTSQWTSTKVPTITTNTLWQVTWITETSIAFPVTSVNGSTGAVTLDADDISDSATTNKFVTTQTAYTSKWTSTKVATITTNTLWQVTAVSETNIAFPVTSVNGSTWAVTWLQSQHTATTATLSSASWSSHTQTVSVTWVTASNTVLVSPAPSSFADYTNAMIYCSAQASGTLTFTCTTDPSSNITVNVVILN